ncbi:MFS transporter [Actinomyces ruminis]|uniref:MFS transporter n=1 Tax=Actinomyces ruminis TaxID=1937003 RepID=UPI00211E3A34|nr:MFS transporter [Actinomyces ruminis]
MTDQLYRTRIGQRFGRRHFFLLIGIPAIFVFAILWVDGMSYWYYLTTYLLFEIVVAMVLIPWETLPNEMTTDYVERTKMSSARLVMSGLATFLATFVPGRLFKLLGENSATPYLVNGFIFATIFAICIAISWGTTWEHFVDAREAALLDQGQEKFSLKSALKDYVSTLRIKSFRKQFVIYLFSFTSMDTWSAVFVYYVVSVLGRDSSVAANVSSLSFLGIFVTMFCGYLFTKITARQLWSIAFTIVLASSAGWWLLSTTNPSNMTTWLIVIGVIYQIGRPMYVFVPWNIFPFIPDVDEMVTGHKRAGVFAAVMTFVRKSTVALATMIVGVLLDASGYIEGQTEQTASAQHMIVAILSIGVAVLILIAFGTALTFKLTRETHQIIVDEIDRLKAGGSTADATAETKRVVKELSGVEYDSIRAWDNYVAEAHADHAAE